VATSHRRATPSSLIVASAVPAGLNSVPYTEQRHQRPCRDPQPASLRPALGEEAVDLAKIGQCPGRQALHVQPSAHPGHQPQMRADRAAGIALLDQHLLEGGRMFG
jgi:hypothetical protein